MDIDTRTIQTRSLARRLLSRVWAGLPEQQRNSGNLRGAAIEVLSKAAEGFTPGQNPYTALREIYANAGKPWSKPDDDELRRLFNSGTAQKDLAQLLGRTQNAISLRLERLGLMHSATSAA